MKHIEDVNIGDEFILTKEVDQYRPIYYAGASGDFILTLFLQEVLVWRKIFFMAFVQWHGWQQQ